MNKFLLVTLFSAVSATSVQAIENQKTVCSHGAQTRVIEVVYTGEGTTPCEVRYSKEEGSKTLWSAANLEGYCEDKAAAFVEKQKGWGWACEASASQEAAAEPVAEEAVIEENITEEASAEEPAAATETEAAIEAPVTEEAPVASAE